MRIFERKINKAVEENFNSDQLRCEVCTMSRWMSESTNKCQNVERWRREAKGRDDQLMLELEVARK